MNNIILHNGTIHGKFPLVLVTSSVKKDFDFMFMIHKKISFERHFQRTFRKLMICKFYMQSFTLTLEIAKIVDANSTKIIKKSIFPSQNGVVFKSVRFADVNFIVVAVTDVIFIG
uniref:Uncharacterized protein n=1 Tax=Romanomermis culicivorax TaxID=13658 RepID=A0A915KLR2_ROMCU